MHLRVPFSRDLSKEDHHDVSIEDDFEKAKSLASAPQLPLLFTLSYIGQQVLFDVTVQERELADQVTVLVSEKGNIVQLWTTERDAARSTIELTKFSAASGPRLDALLTSLRMIRGVATSLFDATRKDCLTTTNVYNII